MARWIAPLVLSIALAPGVAASAPAASESGASPAGITRCGTLDVPRAEADAVSSRVRTYRLQGGSAFRGTIEIAFHVIHCGAEGDVSDAQIDAQVRELNSAYRLTGFSFHLASVDRTDDCQWFRNLTGPGVEKKAKTALAIDPAHRLNVYTASLAHNLLGWAYYPQSFPESNPLHGVVIHFGTLPGGPFTAYSLGGTLDHEVGHYLGLFHTFQNGCSEPGDYVDDTPFEASPAFGCPAGRNTCPQPGDDPIHDYMDYTDDACYSEFTPLQVERMQSIVPIYRPSLLQRAGAGPVALAASAPVPSRGLTFRGADPSPFSSETTLRFFLPRSGATSLALYDVAGQRVATLLDGERAAGEQAVPLRRDGLRPGMYFAALRFGGEVQTRSVLLVP
jgi:hypothetical protein